MTCACSQRELRGIMRGIVRKPRGMLGARLGDTASSKAQGEAYGNESGSAIGTAVGAYYGNPALGAAVGAIVGGAVGGVVGGLFGQTPYDCSFFSANWPDVPLTAEEDSVLPLPVRQAADHQADVWAQTSYQHWDSSWQQTVDACFPNLGSMYEGVRVHLHRVAIAALKASEASPAAAALMAQSVRNWIAAHPNQTLPLAYGGPPTTAQSQWIAAHPGQPLPPELAGPTLRAPAWTTGEKVAIGAVAVTGVAAAGTVVARVVMGRWFWQRKGKR